jgi:hypothetical protein
MGAFDPNFMSMFRDRFGGPDQQPQQGLPPDVAAYAQQRAMPLPPAGASEDELRNAHNRDLLVNVLGHGQGTNESYLNQVQQARQADYARQKALVEADPNSRISQLQGQYRALLDPRMKDFVRGLSASEIGQVLPGAKDAAESSDKRFGTESENTRATASLGGENARAATTAAEIHRHNLATEAEAAARAKEAAAKEKEPKPVPEQEAAKVVNQTEALKALDDLEELHKTTNGGWAALGLSPVGDTKANRYRDAVKASIAAIAAGSAPMGKETPGLMEKIESELPGALTGRDRAHAAFDQLRARIKSNAQGQTAVLKAGGYNPEQVAELAKRADGANAGAGASSSGAPDLRTRIAEMKAEGITDPKTIKAQLKREGLY